jgi:segregation and condensation protein A
MTWCSSWQASLAVAEDASVDAGEATPSGLLLQLDGFEGPLDLLLDLARGQKVDLARISILSLVEQYLAVIEGARRVRLELAADWLVMAAWLTWLKSRLLLPAGSGAAEEGEAAAETLAARLLALQTTRAVARWLGARPQLGHDVFARGAGENFTETDRSRLALDVNGLLRAYLMALRRGTVHRHYRPAPMTLWSVQDWATLDLFLPASLAGPLERRAAVASTLLASLEMARGGAIRLRQSAAFAPIMMRAGSGLPADDEEVPDAALEGDNV